MGLLWPLKYGSIPVKTDGTERKDEKEDSSLRHGKGRREEKWLITQLIFGVSNEQHELSIY